MEWFPRIRFCLSADAAEVENSIFENVIVKVQDWHEKSLTNADSRTILLLLKTIETPVESEAGRPSITISLAKEILCKGEEETLGTESRCIDLLFIILTSKVCERFFLSAGYSENDHRRGLLPTNIEMHFFLR